MPTADNFPLTPLRYWYGSLIAEHTSDPEVKARMRLALETVKEQAIQDLQDSATNAPVMDLQVLAQRQLLAAPSDAQKITVMVELRSMNPFHPHSIRFTDKAILKALERIADEGKVPLDSVAVLEQFWKEASKGFEHKDSWLWVRRMAGAALVAAVTVFVVATAGVAAPVMTALLAVLGGGTVAGGGFGMLGGVVVLLMGSATGGALLAMTVKLLQQLGPEGLRAELVKLEVTQRLWWREGISGVPKRSEVIQQQKQLREHIKALLLKEEKISDKKSAAIESWKLMHALVEKSIKRFEAQ